MKPAATYAQSRIRGGWWGGPTLCGHPGYDAGLLYYCESRPRDHEGMHKAIRPDGSLLRWW